jgi:hypothetical protein
MDRLGMGYGVGGVRYQSARFRVCNAAPDTNGEIDGRHDNGTPHPHCPSSRDSSVKQRVFRIN